MIIPTFEKEKTLAGTFLPVGVDEAGRGPLAGPVVAAAVLYKESNFVVPQELEKTFTWIRDSKKLPEKKREEVFLLIQEHFYVGIGIVSPETIDRVNILQATFLAMKSAVTDLKRKIPREVGGEVFLLIDGNQLLPSFSGAQEAVVGGDSVVRSIAAASIIAKVTRDRMMMVYEEAYPGYGLAQHKGYGTSVHMTALKRLGPTPIHRMSFKPVKMTDPEKVNSRFSAVLKKKV
jgi:ribonuclease HII